MTPTANSWYVGANIPAQAPHLHALLGGAAVYKKAIDDVASKDYEGFGAGLSQPELAARIGPGSSASCVPRRPHSR